MRHVGTVAKENRIANKEFRAQCSCGTAGYFATKEEAVNYLKAHGAKQAGVSTFELVDATDTAPKAAAKPAETKPAETKPAETKPETAT